MVTGGAKILSNLQRFSLVAIFLKIWVGGQLHPAGCGPDFCTAKEDKLSSSNIEKDSYIGNGRIFKNLDKTGLFMRSGQNT